MPSAEQVYNEIVFCEKSAVATATKLGLIKKGMTTRDKFVCKINAHTTSTDRVVKNKQRLPLNSKSESYILPDLKNIQLKDYTGKYKHKNIGEKSPYVEMHNAAGKRILVKKTSLCWLLREESQKLSSDRIQRVKYSAKKKSAVSHILRRNPTKRYTVYELLKQQTNPKSIAH